MGCFRGCGAQLACWLERWHLALVLQRLECGFMFMAHWLRAPHFSFGIGDVDVVSLKRLSGARCSEMSCPLPHDREPGFSLEVLSLMRVHLGGKLLPRVSLFRSVRTEGGVVWISLCTENLTDTPTTRFPTQRPGTMKQLHQYRTYST